MIEVKIMKGYEIIIPKEDPSLTNVKEFTYLTEENVWDNFEDFTIHTNAENEEKAIFFASQLLKEFFDRWYKEIEKSLRELWWKRRCGM